MINILILSAGTRDKVVQYFKEALAGKGKVIATDCSPYAPAIYEADEYVLVPRITAVSYTHLITIRICMRSRIPHPRFTRTIRRILTPICRFPISNMS